MNKDAVRLKHMLDHAREALVLMQGKTRPDLDRDRLLGLGMVRLMEIIGEAANRVSQPVRAAHPGIPWPEIVCMRNRLIHGYDNVDFDILWQIVAKDLPPLITALEQITPTAKEP